jgi:hypothetical protein
MIRKMTKGCFEHSEDERTSPVDGNMAMDIVMVKESIRYIYGTALVIRKRKQICLHNFGDVFFSGTPI